MAQLICKDVTLGYDGKPVIEGLNFSVESGDYLCILGENGSGKSTLVKTLLHLHPAMSGTIETGDGLSPNEIGYLPQQTLVQRDFPASVTEIVRSGLLGRSGMRPFYTKEEKALADENIERLGISHLKKRCYRELSGGQQQRVLLARQERCFFWMNRSRGWIPARCRKCTSLWLSSTATGLRLSWFPTTFPPPFPTPATSYLSATRSSGERPNSLSRAAPRDILSKEE